MRLKILSTTFLILFISCQQSSQIVPTQLYGKWVLDSTSGRGGKIIAGGPREYTEFTLRQNGSFIFKWSDFDVFGEYNGRYAYVKNIKETPMLIFSVYSPERKDSVIRKDSIKILILSDSILKTQEKESYMTLDSVLITHNRINVYKKTRRSN